VGTDAKPQSTPGQWQASLAKNWRTILLFKEGLQGRDGKFGWQTEDA